MMLDMEAHNLAAKAGAPGPFNFLRSLKKARSAGLHPVGAFPHGVVFAANWNPSKAPPWVLADEEGLS